MTLFALMRHGETDWGQVDTPNFIGAANDFAPLTARGIEEVERRVADVCRFEPQVILSSPMTRALQTAAIVGRALDLPAIVEIDLREWLPDRSYRWTTGPETVTAYDELMRHDGEWPVEGARLWEPLSQVRRRAASVLDRYGAYERVLVVCHGVLIQSLTGRADVRTAEVVDLYRSPS